MKFLVRTQFAIILLLAASLTFAAAPDKLNYQAYLTNADGTAVDDSKVISFAVYNVEFGGSPLWAATQIVPIENGLLSIELGGSTNPFPPGLFDTPLWIGLNVDGDGEMQPRRGLSSAAYAFSADTLQGQSPAAFDQSDHVSLTDNPHAVTATQTGAASTADIANLQSQLNDALGLITSLQISLVTTQSDLATTQFGLVTAQSDLANAGIMISGLQSALAAESASRASADANHDSSITSIEANSVLALDGILTHPDSNTALLTGVNLQIVNGAGETGGPSNGQGNLIVGYNEPDTSGQPICSFGAYTSQVDCEDNNGTWTVVHKTGSHNVVVGRGHNYSRMGGIVAGIDNDITGAWSTVIAGQNNIARGLGASVTGGFFGDANGAFASVSGGWAANASGLYSSVTGGKFNQAKGPASSVLGGNSGSALGIDTVVTSGYFNTAFGTGASVSGGRNNLANGLMSSVSGGGGELLDSGNSAHGDYSSILGGRSNVTNSTADYSSISGGLDNFVRGLYAHVSGGRANLAHGSWTVVAGGNTNIAGNESIAIDAPTNRYSVVVGGQFNETQGQYSVVSGGSQRVTSGIHDWRAGSLLENQ